MARKRKVFRSAKMARRQARKRRSKISERRKKEFLWRGYTIEELKEIPLYPWGNSFEPENEDYDPRCTINRDPDAVQSEENPREGADRGVPEACREG